MSEAKTKPMHPIDLAMFIRSCKEDGIGEIYLSEAARARAEAVRAAVAKPAPVQPKGPAPLPKRETPVQAPTPAAVKETEKTVEAAPQPEKKSDTDKRARMIELFNEAKICMKCAELAASRQKVVFGAGNIDTDIVFVGEAPGRDEDEQGLPFVGKAGQLLTKIIESIGYARKDVFICNVLKCRPPGNRTPNPEEVMNCQPYLKKQIALIRPKIICALGNSAAQALLGTNESMARMRGRLHEYEGTPLVCTYHPAYLLRNPADKRKVWDDMQMLKRELDGMKP